MCMDWFDSMIEINKQQVLNHCVLSIQKYKSNLSEEYDKYLKEDSRQHLIKLRPDLYDDSANTQLLLWSKESNPTDQTIIHAINYIKEIGAYTELHSRFMHDNINLDLLYDPYEFLDHYDWILPIAPDIEHPTVDSNGKLLPEMPIIRKLRQILNILTDDSLYHDGTESALDINNCSTYPWCENAVKWNFNGAIEKIAPYTIYGNTHWIHYWVERSLFWAINKVQPPYWTRFQFSVRATREIRIEQVRWAIYLYTYHR